MPRRGQLPLGETERTTLCELRDHGPKAYLRERAAVVLAVANGCSLRQAARAAGLKPHHIETVCAWVGRYRRHGLVGLWIRKGRGRKPADFPPSSAAAAAHLQACVGQAPAAAGVAASYQTRWWLDGVRQAVDWLHGRSLALVCQALRRAGIHWRRGRRHVHSPDPAYAAKVHRLATITWYSRADPQRMVRLFQDELTYYRRASVAPGYTILAQAPICWRAKAWAAIPCGASRAVWMRRPGNCWPGSGRTLIATPCCGSTRPLRTPIRTPSRSLDPGQLARASARGCAGCAPWQQIYPRTLADLRALAQSHRESLA